MAQRLPNPGGDDGTWGDILNAYLEVSLNGDGTLKSNIVGTNQLQNNAVTNAQLDTTTQNIIASVASKYVKPGGGIPSTDMTSAVQTSLGKADTSLQSTQLGAANGIATLDGSSTLTTSQLPSSVVTSSQLVYSIKNPKYGAKGNTIKLFDGALSGAVLTSATAAWTSADVGKTIVLQQCGATPSISGAIPDAFQTTIKTFTGTGQITLNATPPNGTTGIVFTYGTDDSAAIAAAVADATATGGVVYVPVGNYTCGTANLTQPGSGIVSGAAISVPMSSIGFTVKGSGSQSIFTLTPNCFQVAAPNRTADYQLCQNITLEDFAYDGNMVKGFGYTLFGTNAGGSAGTQHRVNFNHIRIHRCIGYGVLSDITTTTSNGGASRSHVSIVVVQLANGEATQNYATDIQVQDLQLTGGVTGINLGGYIPAVTTPGGNIWMDEIVIENCSHDTLLNLGETWAFQWSANYQVGGSANGGKLRARNLSGRSAPDVGFEIDNFDDWLIEDCDMLDVGGPSYLFNNFEIPTAGISNQRGVWRNCTARYLTLPDDAAATWSPSGFRIGGDSSGTTLASIGHITLEGCTWHKPNKQKLVKGEAIYCDLVTAAVGIETITITNFKLIADNAALANSSASQFLAWIRPNAASQEYPLVTIKNFFEQLRGTTSVGGEVRLLAIQGVAQMEIDGVHIDINLTGAGTPNLLPVSTSGSNLRGIIKRVTLLENPSPLNGDIITFETTPTMGFTRVEDCDFSSGSLTPFFFTGSAQQSQVKFTNNKLGGSNQPERWVVSGSSYTIKGWEENIACTGTATTAQTITLPAVAAIYPGMVFTIYDETNAASTHNITITCAGADTFTDGTTSKIISVNGGQMRFYSTGSKWEVAAANMATAVYDPAGINQQLVGTTATQTVSGKRNTKRVSTVAQSATPAINTDITDVASITGLAQPITSMTTSLSGTPNDGDMLIIRITDNGTAQAITWGASFEGSTVALPTTTVSSAMLMVGLMRNTATSKWRCIAVA